MKKLILILFFAPFFIQAQTLVPRQTGPNGVSDNNLVALGSFRIPVYASDPVGFWFVNGAVYLNSTTSKLRIFTAGAWADVANSSVTYTAGSIPFAGAGGALTESNSTLFRDNTTGYVGVGTNSPLLGVVVLSNNNTTNFQAWRNSSSGSTGYGIRVSTSASATNNVEFSGTRVSSTEFTATIKNTTGGNLNTALEAVGSTVRVRQSAVTAVASGTPGTDSLIAKNATTNLITKISPNYYAPTASPTFTGTPAAPTATAGTNTTQLSTTAFVQNATAALLDNVLSKTANYTIVGGDFASGKKTTLDLYVDATAGSVTITLPSAATFAGYTIYVTKTDASANTVTINTVTGTNTLLTQDQSRQFNSNSSVWRNH